jgi:hypothetical protein
MGDKEYIIYLESVIEKLLPGYLRYQQIIDGPDQEYEPVLRHITNKIPALFKKKGEF